jgi:SAM-dependent methyltransferase
MSTSKAQDDKVAEAKELYTSKVDAYISFNRAFLSARAYQAYFAADKALRSGLRILNAGCGTGDDTLALIRALTSRSLEYQTIDAFDLTPAMLARFQESLDAKHIKNVHVREANVLHLESLPAEWTNYDLIVSAAMLEYVPRDALVTALRSLRMRLAPGGRLLLFITRRNWITSILIEKWWKANRYSAEELRSALTSAGYSRISFREFPLTYFWQNHWAHVVEAVPA